MSFLKDFVFFDVRMKGMVGGVFIGIRGWCNFGMKLKFLVFLINEFSRLGKPICLKSFPNQSKNFTKGQGFVKYFIFFTSETPTF